MKTKTIVYSCILLLLLLIVYSTNNPEQKKVINENTEDFNQPIIQQKWVIPVYHQEFGTSSDFFDVLQHRFNQLTFVPIMAILKEGKSEGKDKDLTRYHSISDTEYFSVLRDLSGFHIQILLILYSQYPMVTSNQDILDLLESYPIKNVRAINSLVDEGLITKTNLVHDTRQVGFHLSENGLNFMKFLSNVIIHGYY